MAGQDKLMWQKLAWLKRCQAMKSSGPGTKVQMHFLGRGVAQPSSLAKLLPAENKRRLSEGSAIEVFEAKTGKVYVVQAQILKSAHHYGLFSPSPFAMARDLAGGCLRQLFAFPVAHLEVHYHGESGEEFSGLCVGLEMSQYRFKDYWPRERAIIFPITFKTSLKNQATLLDEAICLGEATNLARFLVDLPANALNPQTYADLLQSHFKQGGVKVAVWDEARLKKEKMGLHVAVGQGARHSSRMVHIEYRGAGSKSPALAFVGKGITFDSGGLDIKPGASMRLMKKDMGGSATVAGLAHFICRQKLPVNCDFYFALAENSINQDAFRPGDILTARTGQTVEIHNTDAEGRLVLADVMTVAREKKPRLMIDVATLTGAIKYGLGTTMPGLFANDDQLADALLRAGQNMGDLAWRMPLIPQEKARLRSEVADLINCTDGFGGAVTAALFLENFAGEIPWAHLDMYAWVDKPNGLFAASGGSGQLVQGLADFVKAQIPALK